MQRMGRGSLLPYLSHGASPTPTPALQTGVAECWALVPGGASHGLCSDPWATQWHLLMSTGHVGATGGSHQPSHSMLTPGLRTGTAMMLSHIHPHRLAPASISLCPHLHRENPDPSTVTPIPGCWALGYPPPSGAGAAPGAVGTRLSVCPQAFELLADLRHWGVPHPQPSNAPAETQGSGKLWTPPGVPHADGLSLSPGKREGSGRWGGETRASHCLLAPRGSGGVPKDLGTWTLLECYGNRGMGSPGIRWQIPAANLKVNDVKRGHRPGGGT